jgi:hypothetical protein
MQNQTHPNNEAGAVAQERLVLRSDYVSAATMEELTTFITQRLKDPDGFDITSIDSIQKAALELCPVGKSYRSYLQTRITHAADDVHDFWWTVTAEQWARSLVSAIVDVDEYCARHFPQNAKGLPPATGGQLLA